MKIPSQKTHLGNLTCDFPDKYSTQWYLYFRICSIIYIVEFARTIINFKSLWYLTLLKVNIFNKVPQIYFLIILGAATVNKNLALKLMLATSVYFLINIWGHHSSHPSPFHHKSCVDYREWNSLLNSPLFLAIWVWFIGASWPGQPWCHDKNVKWYFSTKNWTRKIEVYVVKTLSFSNLSRHG